MDYKKLIKSRKLRLQILALLRFVPDPIMLKLQYRIKTGKRLDLKNPKRFTEKLQWYKLYYKDPTMVTCVDKYDVRDYVLSKGFEEILIPCYGVFQSFEEINFDSLPSSFVIKDTLGGGGNSVIVVKDKSTADFYAIEKQCREWVSQKHRQKGGGREWPYYGGKEHRIIIEKFIDADPERGGLIDYKFFCFHGKTAFIYVIADRIMGKVAKLGIYDPEFHLLPVSRCDEEALSRAIPKPENFDEMKRIAEMLASDFPEARIDLYSQDHKVLFGEITFYDGSGYMKFDPDNFDFEIGEKFILPNKYDKASRRPCSNRQKL